MIARVLAGLAVGDFRDRVRRPAYAATLVAAAGLAYLAVPAAGGRWVIVDVGGYRGVYTSAYVGTVTALAGALWLSLAGFYIVRNAIARDENTRVGQLLAATPLRTPTYLAGKFLSNLLVLASMAGTLAASALVMQLARGESGSVDPVALVLPFVLLALPPLAVTAAAAVLFEATPLLRGGLGNVAWFFVAIVVAVGGQSASAPLGGLGVHPVAESMSTALATERGASAGNRGFSLGLTYVDQPLRTFLWDGFDPSVGFVASRMFLVVVAVFVALAPALWFGRFDPERGAHQEQAYHRRSASAQLPRGLDFTPSAPGGDSGARPGETPEHRRGWAGAPGRLPQTAPRPGIALGRLFAGELHILLQGASRWWWLVAAGLTAAGIALPIGTVTGLVLPMAWVWPVLIWSRLGSQRAENGLEGLLDAYPLVRRRLLAEWASGVALAALVGAAPMLRMVLAADWPGVGSWMGGVLFIPSLAMALGAVSRTHRTFQALYLPLWYAVLNGVAALDYMGAVRADGHPAGPNPLVVAALSMAMLCIVFVSDAARRNGPATSLHKSRHKEGQR